MCGGAGGGGKKGNANFQVTRELAAQQENGVGANKETEGKEG